jgi:hypothetical protein
MILSEILVAPLLVATESAVPWKEHADEAVENFLVIQMFHCASSVSFPCDPTGGS